MFAPKLEQLAAKWSERLITVSRWTAQRGLDYRITDSSRMVTIHNGISDTGIRCDLRANTVPIVTMVARFNQFKDQETLVRAFAQIDRPAQLQLIEAVAGRTKLTV